MLPAVCFKTATQPYYIFSIQLQLKLNTNLLENAHILPNEPDVKNK